jgi:hypothetical protein
LHVTEFIITKPRWDLEQGKRVPWQRAAFYTNVGARAPIVTPAGEPVSLFTIGLQKNRNKAWWGRFV